MWLSYYSVLSAYLQLWIKKKYLQCALLHLYIYIYIYIYVYIYIYIYIYTQEACLRHGLYMLGYLTQLASCVGNYVQYIQFIHSHNHLDLLSLHYRSLKSSYIVWMPSETSSGCWIHPHLLWLTWHASVSVNSWYLPILPFLWCHFSVFCNYIFCLLPQHEDESNFTYLCVNYACSIIGFERTWSSTVLIIGCGRLVYILTVHCCFTSCNSISTHNHWYQALSILFQMIFY